MGASAHVEGDGDVVLVACFRCRARVSACVGSGRVCVGSGWVGGHEHALVARGEWSVESALAVHVLTILSLRLDAHTGDVAVLYLLALA